jgi:hypothetical protein
VITESGSRTTIEAERRPTSRGHRDRASSLDFERPQPDDEPSAPGTRATMREHDDAWIAGVPFLKTR